MDKNYNGIYTSQQMAQKWANGIDIEETLNRRLNWNYPNISKRSCEEMGLWPKTNVGEWFPGNSCKLPGNSGTPDLRIRTDQGGGLEGGGGTQNARETQRFWQAGCGSRSTPAPDSLDAAFPGLYFGLDAALTEIHRRGVPETGRSLTINKWTHKQTINEWEHGTSKW